MYFETSLVRRVCSQTDGRGVGNDCRVAFWAASIPEVDRLAGIAVQAGARNVEGPTYEEARDYAAFFEDPSGNRLEICYRERAQVFGTVFIRPRSRGCEAVEAEDHSPGHEA